MRIAPLPVWEDEPPSMVLFAIAEALETGDLAALSMEVHHYDILNKGTLVLKYESQAVDIPEERE